MSSHCYQFSAAAVSKTKQFFLCVCVLQVIPQISSLSWFTTVVPLILVLSVTALKDATDDIVSALENIFSPNY